MMNCIFLINNILRQRRKYIDDYEKLIFTKDIFIDNCQRIRNYYFIHFDPFKKFNFLIHYFGFYQNLLFNIFNSNCFFSLSFWFKKYFLFNKYFS
jgi:hypothetical protein